MERKKFMKGFLLGIVLTLLVGGAGLKIYNYAQEKSGEDNAVNQNFVEKARVLEEIIEDEFTGEIDKELMETGMYKGMMASLGDPYSAYYTKEEYEELNTETTGLYKGIGVVMQMDIETGMVKLVRCYEEAPGAKAGLLPDDILIKVNNEDIMGMELSEVVEKVKTSEGEIAHLTVAREGENDYLEFDVPLEEVNIPVVEHKMLEDNVGYILLYEFTEQTEPQYLKAFEDLKSQGMERLIVDVRNNPGGLLTSVCNILNDMLPEGLIVYTEDKDGKREELHSDGKSELDMPLVVLVNGNSASASEIFAGAIQDYGVGTIVGTTTFGKGIVQTLIPLGDGSAVKLTTSHYFTKSGYDIHKQGLTPDVEVELSEEVIKKGVFTKEEDNQIQKALEVVKTLE